MQSKFTDFLLSGCTLGLIVLFSWLAVWVGLAPFVRDLLGDYHVIADILLFMLAYGVFSGLALQLLIKFKPLPCGEFSMDSPVFTYWKLLTVIHLLGQEVMLPFTSIFTKPLVWRLFGAKVGANVALGGAIGEPFLVSIGDGAVLGFGSVVAGSVIADGKIVLGEVKIGANATLGVYAVAIGSIEVGDDAKVIGGAVLVPGSKVPKGEVWRGNPARKWITPVGSKADPSAG